MIPSRGSRLTSLALKVGRPRLEKPSTRSISTLTRYVTPFKSNPLDSCTLGSRVYARHRILRLGPVLQAGSGVRFRSSVSTDAPPADNPSTAIANNQGLTPPSSDFQFSDNLDISASGVKNIPEHIGYLKSIGIDYGFGPTGLVEWVLEHIHVLCGTPWWASIALTTVAFRLVFLKVFVNASDNSARMNTIAHITKPLQQKMSEASRVGDTQKVLQVRQEIQMIYKRAGIKLWRSMTPLLQAFVGYGTFVLLRSMSKLPVPGLENGGVLWFPNLTIPDPYFILPLATAGILHLVLRKGGEMGATNLSDSAMRNLAYIFPGLSILFTWWLPAGLQWSFLITTILSQLQSWLLRWAPFRQFMKITPLPKRSDPFNSTASKPSPYQPRIVTVTDKNNTMTYEAPSTSSNAAQPQHKPTIFSGLRKEVNSAVEKAKSAKDSIKALAGEESKSGKRTKAELRAANAYEEKRRREEAERLAALDAERRARRQQRRQQQS